MIGNSKKSSKNVPAKAGTFAKLKLDFGNFNHEFFAFFGRLNNVIDNSLVVYNLRGGNGSFAACVDCIEEGTNLLVEASLRILENRNFCKCGLTCNVVVNLHRTANGAVPALGGRNAQTALGTQNDGVTGGVHVHCPSNSEVENDTALETNECSCEIVNAELFSNFIDNTDIAKKILEINNDKTLTYSEKIEAISKLAGKINYEHTNITNNTNKYLNESQIKNKKKAVSPMK